MDASKTRLAFAIYHCFYFNYMPPYFAYYTHSLDPVALRFPQGWFIEGIYWYGLAYCLGFILAAYLLRLYQQKGKLRLSEDLRDTLLVYLILGVLIGGKLGYWLFYRAESLWARPEVFFQDWRKGMSAHGAFIGVGLGLIYFSNHYKQKLLSLCDLVVTLAPGGIFLGRIANFINGELWGRVTTVPWGVIFPGSAPYPGYPLALLAPRHPSQLYEAILEGLLLLVFSQWRFWKTCVRPGALTSEFLIGYACVRTLAECFREPDASLLFGLTRGQFYSMLLLVLGLGLRWYAPTKEPLKRPIASKVKAKREEKDLVQL